MNANFLSKFAIVSIIILTTISAIFADVSLRVTVAVLTEFDEDFQTQKEVALKAFADLGRNLSEGIEPEILQPVVLAIPRQNKSNPLEITENTVCDKIIQNSSAVILVHPENETEFPSSVGYALGFFHVPVISTNSRTAQFSDKSIYPSFMRTVPSWSDQANVWIDLLIAMDYYQVVLIHTVDHDSRIFIDKFKILAETNKIDIQMSFPISGDPDLSDISELTSNVFLVHASNTEFADAIFEAARNMNITGYGKAWILSEQTLKSTKIPAGSLAVRLDQSFEESLSDAYRTLYLSASRMLSYSAAKKISSHAPANCDSSKGAKNVKVVKMWKEFYLNLTSVREELYERNSVLSFNRDGDRLGSKYEVVNLRKFSQVDDVSPKVFVKVGKYVFRKKKMTLLLNKNEIVWPGESNVAPPTFSLPGRLTAVTVEDAPFVFKWGPIKSMNKCEEMSWEIDNGENQFLKNLSRSLPAVRATRWHPCRYKSQLYCCNGLCVQILAHLTKTNSTKFKFDLYLVDHYGNCTANRNTGKKHCIGVVDELVAERADIAVAALTIDPDREKVIDFSKPWLYHGITIMEKKKPLLNPMETFMQPFKLSLWTCLFASVVIIGICLFTLDKLSPFSRFYHLAAEETLQEKNPLRDPGTLDEETPLSFSGSMWFVWGVLLDSGIGEKTPRSFSARILGMVWCGFCTIMVASYTANLAAFLVLDQPTRSLQGKTDTRLRNPSANFTFATVEGSATYMYFKRHVELSTMFRKMEGKNYANSQQGIQAVRNGSLDAFIWDSTRLEFEAERDCALITSGDVFGNSAYGVGLQKNSPWTRLITLAVLELLEAGTMDHLDSEWISSKEIKECKEMESDESSPGARLGLTNMRDVFFLLAGGVGLGCFLIIFEIIYKRNQLRRLRKRRLAMGYGRLWRQKIAERKCRSLDQANLPFLRPLIRYDMPSDGVSLSSGGLIYFGPDLVREPRQNRPKSQPQFGADFKPEIHSKPPLAGVTKDEFGFGPFSRGFPQTKAASTCDSDCSRISPKPTAAKTTDVSGADSKNDRPRQRQKPVAFV